MLKKYTILATIAMVSASLQLSASSSQQPYMNLEVDSASTTFSGAFSGGYINKIGGGVAILNGDSSVGSSPLEGVQISNGTLSISDQKNIGGPNAFLEFKNSGNYMRILSTTNDMTLASVKNTDQGNILLNGHTLTITAFDDSTVINSGTGKTGEIDVGNGVMGGTLICPLTRCTYNIYSNSILQPTATASSVYTALNIYGTLDCSNITDSGAQLPGTSNFYSGSTLKLNGGGSVFNKNILIKALS